MKRLTRNRLDKEFRLAKKSMNDHWNDCEIRIDGRYRGNFFTNSVDEAIREWKEMGYTDYKHIGITLNNIDANGDIQDVQYTFEYESGV